MSNFKDLLPPDAPQIDIPGPYLEFKPSYSCTADEVLERSAPLKDHPVTPWFHAWALDYIVRRSIPSGPRVIRQTLELPGGIEALAWVCLHRGERAYRKAFFQALEGQVPNPPGPT